MKVVVDTSVIVAVIANGPERAALVRLTKGAELLAPPTVHWEVGNAFSGMLKRRMISLDQALKALETYGKIRIRFLDVKLDLSLSIADELGIYAYDAYILRCAQKYSAQLVSLDRYLVDCAKKMGIRVMEVN
jgi:predicted nucleic acid-binding protein